MSFLSLFKKNKIEYSNYLLVLSFWSILFLQLNFEWNHNKQYAFGIFVPFIGLYLVYLKWQNRPPSKSFFNNKIWVQILISISIICIYPLYTIFHTNVDWRMIAWIQSILIMLTTLLIFTYWGGLKWTKHFFWPFLLFLFSIPWPSEIEIWIIKHLLYFVTYTTVDLLRIFGITAAQNGNIIQLLNGYVSMEEACSGVRSFQSSIMLGYFLGELLDFSIIKRIILIIIGAVSAIIFNILRTTILSFFVNIKGSLFMNEWHNLAGNIVFLSCLSSLILWAWVMHSSKKENNNQKTHNSIEKTNYLPFYYCCFSTIFLWLCILFCYIWYNYKAPQLPYKGIQWYVNWDKIPENINHLKMPQTIQETLVYDEGILTEWKTTQGYYWLAYYFMWKSPKAAQLGGFHGPELCLPTAGWGLPEVGEKILFKKDNMELIFNTFRFSKNKNYIYVFFAQWDWANYPYHKKTGRIRADRIKEVWNRQTSAYKTNLELVVWGPDSFEEAYIKLNEFLNTTIEIKKL